MAGAQEYTVKCIERSAADCEFIKQHEQEVTLIQQINKNDYPISISKNFYSIKQNFLPFPLWRVLSGSGVKKAQKCGGQGVVGQVTNHLVSRHLFICPGGSMRGSAQPCSVERRWLCSCRLALDLYRLLCLSHRFSSDASIRCVCVCVFFLKSD